MVTWPPTGAQQAVDIVAAVMAGHPAPDVRAELDHWLDRRDARLAEPLLSTTVDAIARGCRVLVLPARDADPGHAAPAPVSVPAPTPAPAPCRQPVAAG